MDLSLTRSTGNAISNNSLKSLWCYEIILQSIPRNLRVKYDKHIVLFCTISPIIYACLTVILTIMAIITDSPIFHWNIWQYVITMKLRQISSLVTCTNCWEQKLAKPALRLRHGLIMACIPHIIMRCNSYSWSHGNGGLAKAGWSYGID